MDYSNTIERVVLSLFILLLMVVLVGTVKLCCMLLSPCSIVVELSLNSLFSIVFSIIIPASILVKNDQHHFWLKMIIFIIIVDNFICRIVIWW